MMYRGEMRVILWWPLRGRTLRNSSKPPHPLPSMVRLYRRSVGRREGEGGLVTMETIQPPWHTLVPVGLVSSYRFHPQFRIRQPDWFSRDEGWEAFCNVTELRRLAKVLLGLHLFSSFSLQRSHDPLSPWSKGEGAGLGLLSRRSCSL